MKLFCVLWVVCAAGATSCFSLDRDAFTYTQYKLDVRIEPSSNGSLSGARSLYAMTLLPPKKMLRCRFRRVSPGVRSRRKAKLSNL